MKYTKSEILEFLKSSHKQRIQFEIGIPGEDIITYDLTIKNWIDEMELLDWDELSKYYCKIFEIEKEETNLRNLMLPTNEKTVGNFCEFISAKSLKPKIESIRLFGEVCQEAGIFKYLKSKMAEENKTKSVEIMPSSKIEDYMDDFAFKIVEEVNKIGPKILPIIRYEPNKFEKQNWKLFLSGMITLIFASIINNWFLGGIGIGFIVSGIWMERIGHKMKSEKFEFEGIETFRDLVELIKRESTACNNGYMPCR